jgi:hypothetical protein
MDKGFDTYDPPRVAELSDQIRTDGYSFVGLYFFRSSGYKKHLTPDVARCICRAGLFIVSLWEDGDPTSAEYFSSARGCTDAKSYLAQASGWVPSGSVVYPTYDFDPSPSDIAGPCSDYATAFHSVIKVDGAYDCGAYGSGALLTHLMGIGVINRTMLSQSRDYSGHSDWVDRADIVQGPATVYHGLDIDPDVSVTGNGGGWKLV